MYDRDELDISIVWYPYTGQKNLDFKASALTSENRAGRFDVLPSHANFISIIYNNIVFYKEGRTDNFYFKSGIIEVSNNLVRLFLEGKIEQSPESRI